MRPCSLWSLVFYLQTRSWNQNSASVSIHFETQANSPKAQYYEKHKEDFIYKGNSFKSYIIFTSFLRPLSSLCTTEIHRLNNNATQSVSNSARWRLVGTADWQTASQTTKAIQPRPPQLSLMAGWRNAPRRVRAHNRSTLRRGVLHFREIIRRRPSFDEAVMTTSAQF